MPQSAFLQHPQSPEEGGHIHHVTPENAGWSYVGFDVLDLVDGQVVNGETKTNELCIVLIGGRALVSAGDEDFGVLGERRNVFEGLPSSVYVPAGSSYRIEAVGTCEAALCWAPAEGTKPVRLIAPADVKEEARGKGSNTRHVRNILADFDDRAESLLVVEVITPAGNWSSYPPHKHDQDNFPTETLLEETYYHRLDPPQGYGVQRVYTDDRTLDETMTFGDRDVVLVPRGYHPVGVAHGYTLYYLNVMAGPRRAWRFHNDPAHDWLLKT